MIWVKSEFGNVQRPLVERADPGLAPADLLDRAFDVPVRRAHPVPDVERPIEIYHEPAEEIREQVLCRKADGDASHAAEREHAGDAVA